MAEQRFEWKIVDTLQNAGFLVINCARSKPFDIVVIEDNMAIPIELKQRRGVWKKDQRDMQIELAAKHKFGFMFISQSKRRSKRGFLIDVEYYSLPDNSWTDFSNFALDIAHTFKKLINSSKVVYIGNIRKSSHS